MTDPDWTGDLMTLDDKLTAALGEITAAEDAATGELLAAIASCDDRCDTWLPGGGR